MNDYVDKNRVGENGFVFHGREAGSETVARRDVIAEARDVLLNLHWYETSGEPPAYNRMRDSLSPTAVDAILSALANAGLIMVPDREE